MTTSHYYTHSTTHYAIEESDPQPDFDTPREIPREVLLAGRVIDVLVGQIATEMGWYDGDDDLPYSKIISSEIGLDIRVLEMALVPFFAKHTFKPHKFADWQRADESEARS